jgi:hypothetical protein
VGRSVGSRCRSDHCADFVNINPFQQQSGESTSSATEPIIAATDHRGSRTTTGNRDGTPTCHRHSATTHGDT